MSVPVACGGIAAFHPACCRCCLPGWLLGGNKSESKLTLAINLLLPWARYLLLWEPALMLGQIL